MDSWGTIGVDKAGLSPFDPNADTPQEYFANYYTVQLKQTNLYFRPFIVVKRTGFSFGLQVRSVSICLKMKNCCSMDYELTNSVFVELGRGVGQNVAIQISEGDNGKLH